MTHAPFGTFNPNFYGISVIQANSKEFKLAESYEAAEDLAQWIETRRGASIADVALLSTTDHEVRHFHDILLSPAGQRIMAMRFQASINGLQAILAIRELPGKYVPVPLARWMEWDEGRRASWISDRGRPFGFERLEEFVDVGAPGQDLPDGVSAELPLWIELAGGAYREMAKLRQKHSIVEGRLSVSIDDVLEASAHLIQAQAVWQGQGKDAAERYLHHLATAGLDYLKSYNVLVTTLNQSGVVLPHGRLSELYAWMLLTPAGDALTIASPADRFARILALALEHPHELATEAGSAALWDHLDGLTGAPAWRANMIEARLAAERRLGVYEQGQRTLHGEHYDALFGTAIMWIADRDRLCEAVVEDPEIYTRPLAYLNGLKDSFPRPFIRTQFGSMYHQRRVPLPPDIGRAITLDPEELKVIAYVTHQGGGHQDEIDRVIAAAAAHSWVDFCFFERAPRGLLEIYQKALLEEVLEKKLVNVY